MVIERISVTVLYCILLFLSTSCFYIHNVSARPYVLRNLCRFCDVKSSECNPSGTCTSPCNITSICEQDDDICASAWHRNNQNVTVETVCHPKSQPFHGVMLDDYNKSDCIMRQHKLLGPDFYICSCSKPECNDKLIFTPSIETRQKMILILILVVVLLSVFFTSLFFWSVITSRIPKLKPKINDKSSTLLDTPGSSDIISFKDNTELLPIQLDRIVGKGRFAEVYRAYQKCENGSNQTVAVKIFPLEEFFSWKRECEIVLNAELCHKNILQFLAAEEHLQKSQCWLIMAYHSQGNLCNYLRSCSVKWEEFCSMVGDFARGVAYLHSDRTETGELKTQVAHRDIKSDNVLVKDDMSCCICDFGLSIRLEHDMNTEELANQGQVGTARYMAPELLESRINLENIESFKQADVYAMALVLWEITSRCTAIGEVREYEPPFGKLDQPCIEIMKDIVIRDCKRPEIQHTWTLHPGMAVVCDTIVECWDQDPEGRLTAHCVSERFSEISNASFLCDSELKTNVLTAD